MAFGFEAPSMQLCYEISLLSFQISRKERLLSLWPILRRGLVNDPASQVAPTSMGKKQSSGFFVARENASVKAYKGQKLENGHISATRPPIKIRSTFLLFNFWFFLPKMSKKLGFMAQNGRFSTFHQRRNPCHGINKIWKVENQPLATKPYFFDSLGLLGR